MPRTNETPEEVPDDGAVDPYNKPRTFLRPVPDRPKPKPKPPRPKPEAKPAPKPPVTPSQPPAAPVPTPRPQPPPSHQQPGSHEQPPSPPTRPPVAEQPGSQQPAPSHERGGYWRRENYVDDQLARTLDAYSQAVLNQLLRLSWGYHRDWCHVGLPKLAERCGFSVDRARKSKNVLVARGLVEIVSEDTDNLVPELRGTTYRVKLPAPPLRQQGGSQQLPGSRQPPNKETAFKEQLKTFDASLCPDCFGSGMYYPDGFSKGVARCKHLRL
jgi:hypothetical protein